MITEIKDEIKVILYPEMTVSVHESTILIYFEIIFSFNEIIKSDHWYLY